MQKDGSLRKEIARRGLSLAPASFPLRCLILLLAYVLPFRGQNKAICGVVSAQGVGTEFLLVLLVQRDLNASVPGFGMNPDL